MVDVLNHERPDPSRRAASLNKLAALFGLVFRYTPALDRAEPFVRVDCCLVPSCQIGEP